MYGVKNMTDRIKRTLLFIMITAIGILPACGCNNGDGRGDYGDKEVIRLRMVTYDNGNVPLDAKEVIAAANEVSAEKIGVVADLEFQPTEKINLMMASGEYYDMVFTSSWLNKFDKNASAGLYRDITDAVRKETPKLYDIIGDYWDCASINGHIYG
ncbi:MAG: hypothetical protein K5886_11515, partial [Lachnospiraceae bacterium]|nr:hypothetical protein [Lachnospiraceae bacterium]